MTLFHKKGNVEYLVPLTSVRIQAKLMAGFSRIQATLNYTNLYKDQPVKNIRFEYPLIKNQVVTSLVILIGQSYQVEQKVVDKFPMNINMAADHTVERIMVELGDLIPRQNA